MLPLLLDCCGSRSQACRFRFDSSCAGSGWMVEIPDWAGWTDTEGSDWTLPPDPKTRACWATLGRSEWSCCRGSPVVSPPLCPRWLQVGRHMGPDFPTTGWVHPLPKPGGSGTGDTNCGSLLLNLVANKSTWGWCHREHIAWNTSGWRDHSVWMVWPSLDSLSAITFSRPGMWSALRVTCFLVHQDRILQSRAHRKPDFIPPCLFVDIGNHCCVVCGYQDYVVWAEVLELF